MSILNTEYVVTQFNSPMSSPNNNGGFEVKIPQSSVMLVKPVSYEFRVVEETDVYGKIIRVGLQSKVWEHNSYGIGVVKQDWTDVPRVKLGVDTGTVP